MKRFKNISLNVLLGLVAVLVTLLLLEGLVRLVLPQQLIVHRPDVYTYDPVVGWHQTPNQDTTINTGERTVRLITDKDGFRIGADRQPEGEYRILAVGDSFVQALAVEYDQTMTALLGQYVTQELGEAVEVTTDGVSNWAPDVYLLEVERRLSQSDYDLVIVFIFMGNDLIDQPHQQFEPSDFQTFAHYIHHNFRMPRNLSRAEIIDAVLYPINDTLETRSHLYIFMRSRLESLRIRMGLSPLYIPPGVMLDAADEPIWTVTANIAADIDRAAAEQGVPILFVLIPADYQIDRELFDKHVELYGIDPAQVDLDQPSRLLMAEFETRDLNVVDLTPVLLEAYADGETELYGRIDVHLAPDGHRVVAEYLAPIVGDLLGRDQP